MEKIAENAVVEWMADDSDQRYVERILWIDPSHDRLISIALQDDKAFPQIKTYSEIATGLTNKKCRLIEWIDESVLITPDKELGPKNIEIRDKAWEAIKKIVTQEPDCYDPRLRGALVAESQERTGLHKSTIYRYLRRYWQGGKVKNALLPYYRNCGGGGGERKATERKRGRPRKFVENQVGVNINEDMRQLFRSGIRLFYNTNEKAPLKRAYHLTIEKFFTAGYRVEGNKKIPILLPGEQLPTFGQFKYWFKKERDLQDSLIKRYGKNKYQLQYRPVLGSSTSEAFGPGSRFQIDATIADVFLVSEYRREWIIGRPVVYVVIDVFSRYITGLYIGLEGPSWIGAMMALANTTADKVKFCAEYGIDIEPDEWVCSHLPQKLTADRGELEGHHPYHLINTLGVDVENAAPYRADWKGIVEQQFRLFNLRTIHFIPGAVKERIRERGQRNYRLDARLTLREFTKIMILSVLYHNNHHHMRWYNRNEFMIAEDVPPVPRELWNWGIQNRTGRLKQVPEDIVKLNLLCQGEAIVTGSGIQFKGMYYSCESALREQWFIQARAGRSWRVKVAYDPRTTNEIYLWLDDGRRFETCTLLEREDRYRNKRFEEVEDLLAIERQRYREQETSELQALVELQAYTREIVKEAEKLTNEAIEKSEIKDRERVKGIKTRRQQEKEANREKETLRLGEQERIRKGEPAIVVTFTTDRPEETNGAGDHQADDKLSRIMTYLMEESEDH